MALPFLPGNSFNPNLGKVKYHKSHQFDIKNEVALNVGEEKPGIGGDPRLGQRTRVNNSFIPRGSGPALPAWVAFDKQVLAFDAYFQEAVQEKREEQYRVRPCKIYFYLEDDSIQVIEPRSKNTGVAQGTLIRRHRITRPPPADSTFYTVEDFNIGNELSFYSRTFKLTGCADDFTANFLKKLGVRIGPASTVPADPYTQHRKALDESMQPLRPYERQDTLKQFLDHDRHVLRFYCYWDDSESLFGDPREMILHYFLADDTIEIREIIPPNAGRDAVPTFLHRCKLPKSVDSLPQPGVNTDRTVLNVFGPMGHGGRYILDALKTGAVRQDFYKDNDLAIGASVNVYGRKFLLCDCDDFTKEYYNAKYGITNFTPIKYRQDCGANSGAAKPQHEVPPYNGWGGEEDSKSSALSLMPKPAKGDFAKFISKDAHGLDSHVLRFLAKFAQPKPLDVDREFIIAYYLADDTISVFEPVKRNTGISGGKFLERGRIKKPGTPPFSVEGSQYFTGNDLFVGAHVNFNGHQFIIFEADEYAYSYMEQNSQEFPDANIQRVVMKLRSLDNSQQEALTSAGSGTVSQDYFRSVVRNAVRGALSEHEIVTLARYYGKQRVSEADCTALASQAQQQLKSANFKNFNKLHEMCLQRDRDRMGYLRADDVRNVCQTLQVPLNDDLLCTLLSRMPGNENQEVGYGEFVRYLDWVDHPVTVTPSGALDSKQRDVDFSAMLRDVFGN